MAGNLLFSTGHGVGRVKGRREPLRTFERADMTAGSSGEGVLLAGGDLDESPMAYRGLSDVLCGKAVQLT
ncbi:hypothetical protein [Saccharibacter sp. 17.LH.SD]|uniref:hypothetical protein n=1 Tax=Saccharibacter sp. 17.LH.SD TaxID=2689393 RepID=UPI001F270D6D|nr:hypothetical protein [Saccharibacter sp. 17.LH.SD]